MATELVRASNKDWPTLLKKMRDSKGAVFTQALVGSMNRLEGKRRKDVRAALAERLTRMTAETLRVMAKDEDVELRRAAVLAMAMKDDKAHIPDLIAALVDEEETVSRAAKAGLKSLTGQDFGPAVNATAGEKKLAATAWKEWLSKQKKK
jgi:HEAT repeat protein